MTDIDQLVEKFRAKLESEQEAERYKNEVVNPLFNKIFNEEFALVFQNLVNEINVKVGSSVIKFQQEGKSRFYIEGQYHRVYFQKGKIEVMGELINGNIIPIYVWKGVTKHLGPIAFFVGSDNKEIKWDMPFNSVKEYSKTLFAKLIEDEDFSM